jgi:hypothetical protein
MPQVDHLTFLPQAFWTVFLFLLFFFFFSKWGVYVIKNNINVRFLNILKKKELARSSVVYSVFYNIKNSCKSVVIYNFIKTNLTTNLFNLQCWAKFWLKKGNNDIQGWLTLPLAVNIKNQAGSLVKNKN